MDSEAKNSDKHFQSWGFLKHLELYEVAYFDPRLQPATVLLLGLIIRHTKPDGKSKHFSIVGTAKKKNVSRQAIQNQVKKLVKYGYIKIKTNKGFRSNYTLLFDNLDKEHATQLGCVSEHATQLDCTPATSKDCIPATALGCVNKIEENKNIKKEKATRSRNEFLVEIEKEIPSRVFEEIAHFSDSVIIEQAKKCWDHWSANARFPEGNRIDAFKGWLRKGLRERIIKEVSEKQQDKNIKEENFVNPLQDWHEQIRPMLDELAFRSWIRKLHWDGSTFLQAPNKFMADWVKKEYVEQINKVLPNVEIICKPYEISNQQEPENGARL